MSRDLHHNIKIAQGLAPASLGATAGGGQTSKAIDRQGFEALEFDINVGTITATNATLTGKVLEGDATGAMATAAAASVLGSLNLITATSARASGVSKNVTKRVGYIGTKRYAQFKAIPTATGAMIVSVTGILGSPKSMPVAEQ